MTIARLCALIALPVLIGAAASARAYDDDEQALRLRDTIADPSVPLAWDRRHHPETWRYRGEGVRGHAVRCGKRAYWDGDECVLKRRYR